LGILRNESVFIAYFGKAYTVPKIIDTLNLQGFRNLEGFGF
jgi:hypothetical protein